MPAHAGGAACVAALLLTVAEAAAAAAAAAARAIDVDDVGSIGGRRWQRAWTGTEPVVVGVGDGSELAQVRGYFLVFVQLLETYGTLIERYTALIEKVSPCYTSSQPLSRDSGAATVCC
eukprot:SAG31_NODE_3601_length_4085_cov_1.880582_7_plen_119_part_00